MTLNPCQTWLDMMMCAVFVGKGKASYPTMSGEVNYDVELGFARPGPEMTKPFLRTATNSWKSDSDRSIGMHYDAGFIKCTSPTTAEWILTHNSSNAEVLTGTVSGDANRGWKAEFVSKEVPNATETKATKREYVLDNTAMHLEERFWMKTVSGGDKFHPHLEAKYLRKPGGKLTWFACSEYGKLQGYLP